MKFNICIMISGNGSNLKNIIDTITNYNNYPARISIVISNRASANGINFAKLNNIDTYICEEKNSLIFENSVSKVLKNYSIDLVCLAGFMKILSADFIEQWENKIINIHPSLLPSLKGLNTHKRALEEGRKFTGCTIHHVNKEVDSGKIITQGIVPILKNDTVESLAKRVLEIEHIAYPIAIKKILLKEEDTIENTNIIHNILK